MNKLKELLGYPPPDLEQYRQRGELAYLEDKLQGVRLGEAAEIQNYSRGEVIREKESNPHNTRVARLGKLGWSLGSHGMKVLGSENQQDNARKEEAADDALVSRSASLQPTETRGEGSRVVRAMKLGTSIPGSVKATVRNWTRRDKKSEGS